MTQRNSASQGREVVRGLGDPAPYLLPEETVVVGVRRHVMVLAAALLETIGFTLGAFMIQLLIPGVQLVETVALMIVLAALVRFGYLVLEWRMERFVITDQRMMLVQGVFTRHVAAMPIRKVTDLTFQKPLIGQIFGFGTFIVESAGQDQAMSRIEFLPQANRLYLKVSDLLFGEAAPRVEADLVADPPVAGASAAQDADRRHTDPHLGQQLAGVDFDAPLSGGPVTDSFAVPAMIGASRSPAVEHEEGLRSRLAGLNGRGVRRSGSTAATGPVSEHRRGRRG